MTAADYTIRLNQDDALNPPWTAVVDGPDGLSIIDLGPGELSHVLDESRRAIVDDIIQRSGVRPAPATPLADAVHTLTAGDPVTCWAMIVDQAGPTGYACRLRAGHGGPHARTA